MENGLWAGGFQNISTLAGNLAACAFAALGLLLFMKSRTYLHTYGHPFGDTVLQGVACILGKAARRVDLTARYGGEEFVLLLEGAGEKGALKVAARIRREIENMVFRHDRGLVRVTISVGPAVSPEHGTDKTLLLSRADRALYQAKNQGRNRVVVWRQE